MEKNTTSKYLIREVKCEVANGGMACGPVCGPVVAAVLFEHDGEEQWLHAVEVEGDAECVHHERRYLRCSSQG